MSSRALRPAGAAWPQPDARLIDMALALVGRSAAVSALRASIDAVTAAPCVLIEAEPGLEVVDLARDLHARGAGGPFVAVDCAAAEPATIERGLLGDLRPDTAEIEHIDPRSALARASGGTLYLEDLSDLPAAVQGRLARVASEGEAQVASAVRRLDVRLVASTSADVEADQRQGRLRRDLLQQFARTRIVVPPLRSRAEDLPLMIERLMTVSCEDAGLTPKALADAAMALLAALPWRGNLAELRNGIARLVHASGSPVVELEDVLQHVRFDAALAPRAPAGTLRSARQQFERDYIGKALQQHRWRIGEASRTLGMQRTNLYRKARQLGITLAKPGYRS